MSAPTVIPELSMDSIQVDTIVPFAEGAWFAWRTRAERTSFYDVEHGLWWTDDGSRQLSLATGTTLHHHGGLDWEVYAFKGGADDHGGDVCCHGTRPEADACALVFLTTGLFCSEVAS